MPIETDWFPDVLQQETITPSQEYQEPNTPNLLFSILRQATHATRATDLIEEILNGDPNQLSKNVPLDFLLIWMMIYGENDHRLVVLANEVNKIASNLGLSRKDPVTREILSFVYLSMKSRGMIISKTKSLVGQFKDTPMDEVTKDAYNIVRMLKENGIPNEWDRKTLETLPKGIRKELLKELK